MQRLLKYTVIEIMKGNNKMFTKTENNFGKSLMCFNILLVISTICICDHWMFKSIPNFLCYASYCLIWLEVFRTEQFFQSWFKVMPVIFVVSMASTNPDTVWGITVLSGVMLGFMTGLYESSK